MFMSDELDGRWGEEKHSHVCNFPEIKSLVNSRLV